MDEESIDDTVNNKDLFIEREQAELPPNAAMNSIFVRFSGVPEGSKTPVARADTLAEPHMDTEIRLEEVIKVGEAPKRPVTDAIATIIAPSEG